MAGKIVDVEVTALLLKKRVEVSRAMGELVWPAPIIGATKRYLNSLFAYYVANEHDEISSGQLQ
ncbi:hypothetical protein CDL15_Pgr010765 [Punica granatum]|uniref:Uncharacterized protein n=1 Tax=Punica granatum TaxID=22663 RepID=A0A218W4P7_PUNGR|nr:hypothetical protein CDL15_Pgr010765 [Punica granatum]